MLHISNVLGIPTKNVNRPCNDNYRIILTITNNINFDFSKELKKKKKITFLLVEYNMNFMSISEIKVL